MKYRSPGGLWDAEDDCCEPRFAGLLITLASIANSFFCIIPNDIIPNGINIYFRCTSDHPCTHGEGHCIYDSDCERNGYHTCSEPCIGIVKILPWAQLTIELSVFAKSIAKS